MVEEPQSPSNHLSSAPENQETWRKMTELNMMKSRNAVREMLTRCRQNEIEEASNKAAAQEAILRQMEVAKKQVYSKAAAHGKVIDVSFRCMQDIEDATLQMEDTATKLKHERMQGFAALQVCTRRMELRSKRPLSETFNDSLSEALLNEKRLLEELRSEIFNLEGETKKAIDDMSVMRASLSQDTGVRRLEMAHDFSSLKPNLAPVAAHETKQMDDANGRPASPDREAAAPLTVVEALVPAKAAAGAAAEGEVEGAAAKEDKKESKLLIEATQKLLQRGEKLRIRALALIDQAKQDSKRALNRTEEALSRRTAELHRNKKNLEAHMLDVEAAIATAVRSLDRLEKRIDQTDEKKREKLESDRKALKQLKESRVKLQEDIRSKFAALEIDNLCRRVTPAKADSAKRQTAMSRTSSAPTLRNAKKSELGSSFNGMYDSKDDSMDGSTRAPSSIKHGPRPGTPPGGSATLRSGAAAAGLH